jgi:AraC-like DNA-binding protein
MDFYWSKPTRSAVVAKRADDAAVVDPGAKLDWAPPPTAQAVLTSHAQSTGLFLVVQPAGEGRIAHRAWEAQLSAGDAAVCAGTRPAESITEDIERTVLNFSLPEGFAAHDMLRRLPVVLRASNPTTGLVIRVAQAVHRATHELDATSAAPFVGGLLSMLAAALDAQQPELAAQLPKITRFHLERIKTYLRAHMRDPGLTLDALAQGLQLSVAHIHRLFTHEGCTVCEWLWAQRLEHCAAELASAAHGHRSVGEIALSWGFNDHSHFSRAFRKRYGMSPKEWRNRTPWRKTQRS